MVLVLKSKDEFVLGLVLSLCLDFFHSALNAFQKGMFLSNSKNNDVIHRTL